MCDDDKFGSLEVWKFGGLEVYTLCAMMMCLEVRKFGSLQVVCDDDKFGSLEAYQFTGCV